VPGAMVLLGAAPEGPGPWEFNHSPRAVFDESVLADGAALYAELALQHLAVDPLTASPNPLVPADSRS
jgi:hypothetical protein